jgi:F-type H+-transporting ATPase subunit epsilon
MLHVHILSPEKKLFQGKAQMIGLPGEDGRFQILPQHAPIVASLGDGEIKLQDEQGNDKIFHIQSGFVEVLNNTVNILVQGANVLQPD